MKKAQARIQSEIGPVYLVASAKGLCGVFFKKQAGITLASAGANGPEAKILRRAVRQFEEYFAGKRKRFDLPLDAQGTPFQKSVWKELHKIPYGATHSYKDIAARIRNAKSVRAVGAANGKNPLCIVVPCHRVIAADGTIGGYSGGLRIKKKLLALEQGACACR